jgi:hypothetical protein
MRRYKQTVSETLTEAEELKFLNMLGQINFCIKWI